MISRIFLMMNLLTVISFAADVSAQLTGVFKRLENGEKQTVVLYGTSLTIGGEWAMAMKTWFDKTYPGQVTFVNSGKGGANSDFGAKKLEERVLAHRPDFVLIEFSYNDAIDKVLSPEQAWNNLDRMVSEILKQNPEAAVVLQTMNTGWDPRPDHLPFSRRARLETFNDNYRRYAKEHALPFIDHYPNWLRLKEQESEKFQAYLPDGSHPTPEASLAITWPSVKALLEAASASTISKS